jgi:hypothetical protein
MFALAALGVLVSGCSMTGPSGMSQDEVEAFVQQFAGPVSNSMASVAGSASQADGLSRAAAVLVNVPISARTNCTVGGNIQVTGSMTGSIDDQTGSGVLSLEANETITDWQCIGDYVMNGDPYISLAGTFSFLNGNLNSPAEMDMGGGFKWGTGGCNINLTFLIYADGSGRVSGTVCNRSVNLSVS